MTESEIDQSTVLKRMEADKLMKEWIAEFTTEVDEIDNFYTEKLDQYAQEFLDMQVKYLCKVAYDNNEANEAAIKKANKKEKENKSTKNTPKIERKDVELEKPKKNTPMLF